MAKKNLEGWLKAYAEGLKYSRKVKKELEGAETRLEVELSRIRKGIQQQNEILSSGLYVLKNLPELAKKIRGPKQLKSFILWFPKFIARLKQKVEQRLGCLDDDNGDCVEQVPANFLVSEEMEYRLRRGEVLADLPPELILEYNRIVKQLLVVL